MEDEEQAVGKEKVGVQVKEKRGKEEEKVLKRRRKITLRCNTSVEPKKRRLWKKLHLFVCVTEIVAYQNRTVSYACMTEILLFYKRSYI